MKSHDHKHVNKNPLADSAGVPWDGRAFNENPFADDDGSARPELVNAIREFHETGDASKVFSEFSKSRLLIPLLADLGESEEGAHGQTIDKSADLSIVNVETPDGQIGLPVFSSVETMQRWNSTARPVPSDAIRVALAAASEGNTRIILDPGSETEFAFRRAAIAAMAQQQSWIPPHLSTSVIAEFEKAVATEDVIAKVSISSLDPKSRLAGPEVKVQLHVVAGLDKEQLEEVLHRVTQNWAESDVIASSVDSMALVVKPAENKN
ncbi:MAG: hypothetical protein RL351_1026 [Actinomycetota bacterium]|jgi:SseB protein N-terminal domain